MTRPSSTIHIGMPPDFPVEPYDAVNERLGRYQTRHPDAWKHWSGGWNGVGSRFRTCADADEAFSELIIETNLSFEQRRLINQSLFTFFVAGSATIDSLAYALYSIGATVSPNDFPMSREDLWRINLKKTVTKFGSCFSDARIALQLQALFAARDHKEWREVRNVVVHRALPPWIFVERITEQISGSGPSVAVGAIQCELITFCISIDDRTTASGREWLTAALRKCIEATGAFVDSNFS